MNFHFSCQETSIFKKSQALVCFRIDEQDANVRVNIELISFENEKPKIVFI